MPSIKENIKEKLLEMLAAETTRLNQRRLVAFNCGELYQMKCEERFIESLEEFVKSL